MTLLLVFVFAEFVKNTDQMIKQSVWSSVIASKVAAKYLKENGLLTLTGAKAALDPTPGMIGYGLAKAAVHQLTKSLAASKSGLPNGSTVLAILPVTLDTPMVTAELLFSNERVSCFSRKRIMSK